MTKSEERGENEFTRSATQEAKRTGEGVCSILARWLSEAQKSGKAEAIQRIRKAEKHPGCRNIRRRRRKR
jgi:hypothetical protein